MIQLKSSLLQRLFAPEFFALFFCMSLVACGEREAIDLNHQEAKVGYALGYDYGKKIHGQEIDLHIEAFQQGLAHAMSRKAAAMSAEEIQTTLAGLNQRVSGREKRKQEQKRQLGEANRTASRKFFSENAQKEGVISLPSGLQYEVISASNGPKPKPQDRVKVHYRGTLINGREFDNSWQRGEPAEFQLNQVIGGWVEGLQLMPQGSKWRLFVPSNLAYGDRGASNVIGPHAALIFEVELLEVIGANPHQGH